MIIVESVDSLRAHLWPHRAGGERIGFVPTMGYLHDGHIALVRQALEESDLVVVSIFVNPTQFAPHEDLSTYPRDPERDRKRLEDAGCHVLFLPSVEEIYPEGFSTYISVESVSQGYEGAFRPEHFRGVTTVVGKLFNIVGPDLAVFGQKDAQQVAVVRRMIRDLNFGVRLAVGETVREPDGLAMSSRNVYLSAEDRAEALSISRALFAAREVVAAGAGPQEAASRMREILSAAIALDYADVVDPETFQSPAGSGGALLGIIAGRVGKTRLIDNLRLDAGT